VKKLLLTVLIACALLVAASMVAEATSPTEVSGEGDYTFQVSSTREAGPNLFMHATENEQWRGDMTGTGNSEFTVGMFAAGFWTVELRCEFQGAIGGKQGTLQLLMVGKKPLGSDWHGKWVIGGGGGGLSNAHGEGIWWGPGYRSDGKVDGDPDFRYSGQVHFDPR